MTVDVVVVVVVMVLVVVVGVVVVVLFVVGVVVLMVLVVVGYYWWRSVGCLSKGDSYSCMSATVKVVGCGGVCGCGAGGSNYNMLYNWTNITTTIHYTYTNHL